MATTILIFCLSIFAVSLLGGWFPMKLGPSHRAMQIAISFVAGIMFGLAVLDLLPEAIHAQTATGDGEAIGTVMMWVIFGFLSIFILERFICFHHHETPGASDACGHHEHAVSWIATGIGLSLHGLMAGVALAAAVRFGYSQEVSIPGLALFLAIIFHKPFDSMSLITIMTMSGHSIAARHIANILFALVTPVGVILGWWLVASPGEAVPVWLGPALGFAVGMFLCVSLSDLLPELQFHRHDRILLTIALILGLGVAWFAGLFHDHEHAHDGGGMTEEGARLIHPESLGGMDHHGHVH